MSRKKGFIAYVVINSKSYVNAAQITPGLHQQAMCVLVMLPEFQQPTALQFGMAACAAEHPHDARSIVCCAKITYLLHHNSQSAPDPGRVVTFCSLCKCCMQAHHTDPNSLMIPFVGQFFEVELWWRRLLAG